MRNRETKHLGDEVHTSNGLSHSGIGHDIFPECPHNIFMDGTRRYPLHAEIVDRPLVHWRNESEDIHVNANSMSIAEKKIVRDISEVRLMS
jgi:hypothetical protein